MRIGRTEKYLYEKIEKEGFIHITLIDPDKADRVEEIVRAAIEAGSSAFMIGGSTSHRTSDYEETIARIKSNSSLPVIIFPSSVASIARGADAIWFMSLLNSANTYYIIGAQVLGAKSVRELGLDTIPMAYLILGGGGAAGYIGEARPLPFEIPELTVGYAMAAEMLGFRFVYLEAGSGAKEHVPEKLITMVRRSIRIPLIVGGGIRNSADAESIVSSGADIIVTGDVLEESRFPGEKLKEIVDGGRRGVTKKNMRVDFSYLS
ncbi:MAG: geranylgeranylglyceryl/heptaprenylglyceryl phosphate synthase [Thermoproteota archaeon]